jgi:hypothetical protein
MSAIHTTRRAMLAGADEPDAKLLALAPALDAIAREFLELTRSERRKHIERQKPANNVVRFPGAGDDACAELDDRLLPLCRRILRRKARTVTGLAIQARALSLFVLDDSSVEPEVFAFISSACRFMDLPFGLGALEAFLDQNAAKQAAS